MSHRQAHLPHRPAGADQHGGLAHDSSDGHAHDHGPGDHHNHDHDHKHGLAGVVAGLFRPHSHDSADSVDSELESSALGVRAVKISLIALLLTAALQVVVVGITGSVALFADTVHNFSDALTAVPLWIAFVLGRRPSSRRYTYGYGRVEDLAGLFIVAMIALSAVLAGWEAIDRLINPQPVTHLGWLAIAGLIGFVGNELVAVYRIRIGRRIGSAALVTDGLHARTDGFTSLAILLGAAGVALGWPAADPIIGLVITIAILAVLRTATRDVFRRLLDGVDPQIVDEAEDALLTTPGVLAVRGVQIRWIGHTLRAEADIEVASGPDEADPHVVAHRARQHLISHLPRITAATIHASPSDTPSLCLPAD